jgi:hypothetical protein
LENRNGSAGIEEDGGGERGCGPPHVSDTGDVTWRRPVIREFGIGLVGGKIPSVTEKPISGFTS